MSTPSLFAGRPRATPALLASRQLLRRTDTKFVISPAGIERVSGVYARV